MKLRHLLIILALLSPGASLAADKATTRDDDAFATAKYAQIEVARLRSGAQASPSVMASMIEAEDLLRRFREAPAAQKPVLRSQLDAAAARLDMETSSGMSRQ